MSCAGPSQSGWFIGKLFPISCRNGQVNVGRLHGDTPGACAVDGAMGITDGLGRQRSDCSFRHLTLAGCAVGSLRKSGLAITLHEMLKRRSVAKWLGRGPVAGCEMRIADEKQFGFRARLVEPAQLGKARGEETA
jgi:hypothetical protein